MDPKVVAPDALEKIPLAAAEGASAERGAVVPPPAKGVPVGEEEEE